MKDSMVYVIAGIIGALAVGAVIGNSVGGSSTDNYSTLSTKSLTPYQRPGTTHIADYSYPSGGKRSKKRKHNNKKGKSVKK